MPVVLTTLLLTFDLLRITSAQFAPVALQAVCKNNIEQWEQVPHDWDQQDTSTWDGNGNGGWMGRDWWYWGSDWSKKIAAGDVDSERISQGQMCTSSRINVVENVNSLQKCQEECAFEYTTQEAVREKCSVFAYDSTNSVCVLYANCWGGRDSSCSGTFQETGNAYSCGDFDLYRVIDIYPAGFKPYNLREFNEPPTCIHVPNSANKKVEVMIETAQKDSRICIMDGNDMGIGTNSEVGNVETCDNGQLYACFTAATQGSGDFYFYIYCDGSCESTDVDLWVRIRVSETNWNAGKQSTADDIEMWCEMEKGSKSYHDLTLPTTGASVAVEEDEFTWPSELLPDYPEHYPYRIKKVQASTASRPGLLFAVLSVTLATLATFI